MINIKVVTCLIEYVNSSLSSIADEKSWYSKYFWCADVCKYGEGQVQLSRMLQI